LLFWIRNSPSTRSGFAGLQIKQTESVTIAEKRSEVTHCSRVTVFMPSNRYGTIFSFMYTRAGAAVAIAASPPDAAVGVLFSVCGARGVALELIVGWGEVMKDGEEGFGSRSASYFSPKMRIR
jgi:hypothetical protein